MDESALLARWAALTAELARLRALAPQLAVVREVTQCIADAGAPGLAQRLPQPGHGSPEALQPERLRAAWRLRRLATHLPLYRAQMSPERSIYDLARVVFARSGVMLKEHFRCVAPIIEYSKREFYHYEVKPLRLPRPSERLDPPLVDVYIEDGVRKDGLNPAEIDYIVREIARIAADPRMAQRSIGVVSLLGEE